MVLARSLIRKEFKKSSVVRLDGLLQLLKVKFDILVSSLTRHL